jgi:two-component system chemotaxis response regulator CheB
VTTDQEDKSQHEPNPVGRPIRVLIVDDSALMRRLLGDLLRSAPEIVIAGTASNGRDAIAQARQLKPDVITLDVEMPEVSGLEALPTILAVHEVPIVMVSALTQEGADVTLQALELGAVDFMPKPEKNQLAELRASRDLLVAKVLAAAHSRVRRPRRGRSTSLPSPPTPPQLTTSRRSQRISGSPPPGGNTADLSLASPHGCACIVIGISTGGPQALSQLFPAIAPPMPPILVVQHMPGQFTGVFAERLNRYSNLEIKHAEEGDLLLPDRVLVAPGGRHMTVAGIPPRVRVVLSDDALVSGHRPSIDVLFQSAARIFQAGTVGLIMTGMGRDGVEGCKEILAFGGLTIGQDEPSSVVYGMNKAAFLEGAIKAQFSLDELAAVLQHIAAYRAEIDSNSATE